MTQKKARDAKQKKIVVASIVLSAMTVVGGTFAWFTAQDEVTNKLTGVNNYGTSIVEDFVPPSDLIPGMDVNKDVYITNTGNVDAFVRVDFTDTLDIVKLIAGTDTQYVAAHVDQYDELSTTHVDPSMPDVIAQSEDEVKSLQAGGTVVCEAGATVQTRLEEIEDGTNYVPTANGLYVFERVNTMAVAPAGGVTLADGTEVPAGSTYRQIEYAGYWKQGDKFYAVSDIENNEGVYSAKMVMTQASEGEVPVLDYTKVTSDNLITATYGTGDEAFVMNISLADDWATNWTFDATNNIFYYNNTLKAGTTSDKLVDSMELDESVTNDAYKAFEYNLNIHHNSAQITKAENGNDTAEAVLADTDTWTMTPALTIGADGTTTAVAWS